MTDRLAEHIDSNVSEERMERLWQGIEARNDEFALTERGPRARTVFGSLAVAAAVSLGWFFGASLTHEAQTDPREHSVAAAPLEAGGAELRTANKEMSVDLSDGSKVTLAPRSRVSMQETHSNDVALSLQMGRIACNVAKDRGRTFSVVAGEATVRVIGTRFSVERAPTDEGERVRVDVVEGIVEVSGPDGVRKRLSSGESWSVKVNHEPSLASTDEADIDEADIHEADIDEADIHEAPTTTKKGPPSAQAPLTKAAQAKKSQKAVVAAETEEEAARDLFEAARAKRNAGDAAGAARLYQNFLQKHGSDGRSGVAALELGRLRMDQLGDVAGAIGPLNRAAASGAGGLGDDALARLARAHSRLGQLAACRSARARYMKSYPRGVHVEQVRGLCP